MPRAVQLRTDAVQAGKLDEWVTKWRELVIPLRRKFGFEIHGAWTDRERSQHTSVVSYDGAESFEERNAAYWASPQREAMGLDPMQYLVGEDPRVVEKAL